MVWIKGLLNYLFASSKDFSRVGGEVLCVCIEFAISEKKEKEREKRQSIPERSEEMSYSIFVQKKKKVYGGNSS